MKHIFLLFFSYFFVQNMLFAQTEGTNEQIYVIQLGAFKYPDPSRFSALNDLGKIYTQKIENQELTRILLGKFNKNTVDSILTIVKDRGFKSSFSLEVQNKEISDKIKVFSVQIGIYEKNADIPTFNNLSEFGEPYQYQEDELIKIRIGQIFNKDTAIAKLQKIKDLGYSEAILTEMILPPAARYFKTNSYYKRMEGTLNEKSVTVHLYFSNTSLTGYYNEPKTGIRKKFVYYGYQDDEGVTARAGNQGIYKESDLSKRDYKINITVKDAESGINLKFSLSENYPEGSTQFEVVSIFKKKLATGNQGEMGIDLYVEYPIMKNASNKNLEEKFNTMASQVAGVVDKKTLLIKVDDLLKSSIETIKRHYPQYKWLSETYETKILENTQNLLSVRFSKEHIISEPESQTFYKSFDLRTGKELTLSEVLTNNYEKTLRTWLEKSLQTYYKMQKTDEISKNINEMLKNYYFTTSGLVFFRNYQASYKMKEPFEMTIPYTQLRAVMKKGTLLTQLK